MANSIAQATINVSNTHLSTAHCTQDGALVLILSCQTNSIHNTSVLKAICLMEREAMEQSGKCTEAMTLTGAMRFLVVSRRSWATLTGWVYTPEGGLSNREHTAVKSLPPINWENQCMESQVTMVTGLSPVGSEMHSCKELMFHCIFCWGYTIHTDCWAPGNPYSCRTRIYNHRFYLYLIGHYAIISRVSQMFSGALKHTLILNRIWWFVGSW